MSKNNIAPNEVYPEHFKHAFTVGELLDFIEKHNITRDAKVFYQRIEDNYFLGQDISGFGTPPAPPGTKTHGWPVVKKQGWNYQLSVKWNEDIDSGKYNDSEQYPNAKPEDFKKYTEEQLLEFREEYIAAHCAVKYTDDNNLYIDAHY